METKHNPIERCELKFDADAWTFEGYASSFGDTDLGGDTIHPGAFKKTLTDRSSPVLMRYEHLRFVTPGKWVGLTEDSVGLAAEGELTKGHSAAIDLRASMQHDTVRGLSIGYTIPAGGFEKKADGGRNIYEINLVEISPTASPMDQNAIITSFKSEIESIDSLRDVELFLRDAGTFSRSMAKAFISQCRPLYQREVDDELKRKEAMTRDLEWLRTLTD